VYIIQSFCNATEAVGSTSNAAVHSW